MATIQLNILAAVFAFFAAMLWVVSAVVEVKHKEKIGPDGWTDASIISYGGDLIASLRLQQKWSRRAAYMAAVAATLQGAALALPFLT